MSFITILVYVCVGALVVVPIVVALVYFVPLILKQISQGRLQNVGVSAPATVNSVTVGTAMSSGSGAETRRERLKWRVYFNVLVHPENEPPFQAEFMSFLNDHEREDIEKEKKIWVRYDPQDHSKVTFEQAGSSREQQVASDHFVQTVPAYWEMDAKYYAPLRLTGMRSEAVILQREKIMDASSTPGGPFLYQFWLDVIPASGSAFKAETQMMIQDEEQFGVGQKIFVRFNPANPQIVAMEQIF